MEQRRGVSLAQAPGTRVPAAGGEFVAVVADDLCNIERQKGLIEQNTRQFVRKSPANNVLIYVYATSNRRHLLPEYMSDNETYEHTSDCEIHPGEVVEEKISLSERFGL